MRIALAASLMALSLAACSPAAETSVVAESPVVEAAVTPTSRRDSCKDIAALAAAMSEPEPFASLRASKAKLGDRELDDRFTTAIAPAAATCELGKLAAFDVGGGDVYVANRLVFSTGMLDREANAIKAKAAFDAARADLDSCLPKDWSSRDGSQPDPAATEVMIYEPADDAKRSMDAGAYLYPVELRKAWSEGNRADPPGWRVTLSFQQEASATSAPDQQ